MSTMLSLKNVKKDGDLITADYYPKDSQVVAHISVLATTNLVFEALLTVMKENI